VVAWAVVIGVSLVSMTAEGEPDSAILPPASAVSRG